MFNPFNQKDLASSKASKFLGLMPDQIILVISIISSVLCFIPTFDFTFTSVTDDYTASFNSNTSLLQASYASLIICLLPGLDLFLDIIPSSIFMDTKLQLLDNAASASTAVRLNHIEKFLFLLGVLSYSVAVYPSFKELNSLSPAEAGNLFVGFENASTILSICPIMALLYRVSTSWNATITISITVFTCFSSVLSSVCPLFPNDSVVYNAIFILSCLCINLATMIYIVACGLSAYRTHRWIASLQFQEGGYSDSLAQLDAINEQKFRNIVIAAHMAATIIELLVNSVWFWMYLNLTAEQISIFIYFCLSSSILTFLIEFRVRKSEVATALVALLDSKKSYVRYISHELRTPLNAATLGLKLISDDIKNCPNLLMAQHPRAADLVECLDDVQLACGTSVNILNDLLSFEKLDSGILELHRENIPIVSFATDSIKIFSGEAREKDMELVLDLAITAEEKQAGLCEITEQDELSADRFKMEQVLRNLVSNAIKFSSSNSAVRVQMYFKPREDISGKQESVGDHRSQHVLPFRVPYVVPKYFPKRPRIFADTSLAYQSAINDSHAMGGGEIADIENGVDLTSPAPTTTSTTKGFWVLKVTDTGAGISQDNQKKLFRGVVQFSPEKLQAGGGSGFGLFICKGIVELHKGLLYVESAGEGRGSTFTMELPMERKIDIDIDASYCPAVKVLVNSRASADTTRSTFSASIKSHRVSMESSDLVGDYMTNRKMSVMSIRSFSQPTLLAEDEVGTMTEDFRNDEFSSSSLSERRIVVPRVFLEDRGASSSSPMNNSSTSQLSCNGISDHSDEGHLKTPTTTPAGGTGSTADMKGTSKKGPAHYRLLIVDDSSMNRKLLSKVLTAAGHTCDVAEDGLAAVSKIKAQLASTGSSSSSDGGMSSGVGGGGSNSDGGGGGVAYDGILMDFIMPNMDGPTATKVIRDLKVTIPIFGVTGNCMKRDVDWFVDSGANSVLFKPFDLAEFDRKMQEALSKRDH